MVKSETSAGAKISIKTIMAEDNRTVNFSVVYITCRARSNFRAPNVCAIILEALLAMAAVKS